MNSIESDIATLSNSSLATRAFNTLGRAGTLARFVAVAPIPSEPVLIEGLRNTDWIIMDARDDPHVRDRSLGLPRKPLAVLRQLAATGVDFDTFLIGHELPPGTVANLPERAAGAPVDFAAVRESIGKAPADRATRVAAAAARSAVKGVQRAALGVGVTLGALALTPFAPLALLALDPVIFGAVTADGRAERGDLAAIFYICHWNPST